MRKFALRSPSALSSIGFDEISSAAPANSRIKVASFTHVLTMRKVVSLAASLIIRLRSFGGEVCRIL